MTRHEPSGPPEGFEVGPWDVKPREYHRDRTCVSHSLLEVFRASVPLYHAAASAPGRFPGPNPDMVIGSALHAAVLDPDGFEDFYRRDDPEEILSRGVDPVALRNEITDASRWLAPGDHDRVLAMRDAILSHPCVGQMIAAAGESERAVRWIDRRTGLPMKAMMDRVVSGGPTIDLKTCDDPSPAGFARSVVRFGYHRQAALYVEARREALGVDSQMILVAVGSAFPHEVGVYYIPDADLLIAAEENARLLRELRDCLDFDQWGSRLPRWPTPLPLPTP